MSLNSLKEIENFIKDFDPGDAIYNIKPTPHKHMIIVELTEWKAKNDLHQSNSSWLNRHIIYSIGRTFDSKTSKMKMIYNSTLARVKDAIASQIMDVYHRCSPFEQPRRSAAYKDMAKICMENQNNNDFINSVLPVINYFYDTPKDSQYYVDDKTHKSNVYALFEILRKKYGNRARN